MRDEDRAQGLTRVDQGAANRRRWQVVAAAALVATLTVLASCSSTSERLSADATTTTASGAATVSEHQTDTPAAPPTVPEATAPVATEAPTTEAPAAPAGNTVVVIKVVDGDTIDVAGGVRVRVIGIDTPERGVCGAKEATEPLRTLIGDQRVTLVPGARDDHDRYGRLLRYLDVNGVDLGLQQIRTGHAIARYDSRDGYGRHAREDQYIATAGSSPRPCGLGGTAPQTTVAAAPAPAPPVAPSPAPAPAPAAGGTDQRFGTCAAAIAAGLGPYRSGVDPESAWSRDADHDGTVCAR